MRHFSKRELREAYAWAEAGGQALHVHRFTAPATAPAAFRQEPNQEMAHLLDQDADRLHRTAVRLGLRYVHISHRGTRRQHVDLCGEALERAKAECGRQESGGAEDE